MSTIAEYTGRQADLVAFRAIQPHWQAVRVLLAQQLVGIDDGGALVAGIHKLAQKVLVTLLTPLGSKIHRPQDGTLFLIDGQQGRWRTVADITQSFYSARVYAAQQIVADEEGTDPSDERYNGMELTGVTLVGDAITLSVTLTSLAGSTYTVLAPITVAL